MNPVKRFFLERELYEIQHKKAKFQALIEYKAKLDREESIFDKLIMAKLKVNSEYDYLSEILPGLESRKQELFDLLSRK